MHIEYIVLKINMKTKYNILYLIPKGPSVIEWQFESSVKFLRCIFIAILFEFFIVDGHY